MMRCQLDEFIKGELENLCLNSISISYIENIITSNIKAFTFANKSLENLDMYIVIRNLGEAILFKTVNGKIVKTKLDIAYTKSRELIGIESWNIKKIFKLSFSNRGIVDYTSLNLKQLKAVLNDIIEPHNIYYTIKIRDKDSDYHTLRVDRDLVAGLDHDGLMEVIKKAYESAVGVDDIKEKLDIYLVDYVKNREE